MARKKIREYDSKRLLKQHIKRLAGLDLPLKAAQVCPRHFKLLTLCCMLTWSPPKSLIERPPCHMRRTSSTQRHDLLPACAWMCVSGRR